MKRNVFGLVASLTLAGTLVIAQEAQQPASRPQPSAEQQSPAAPASAASAAASAQQKSPDVTLTGCLVQGSGPTVFILENARAATDPATSKGPSYVLQVAAGSSVDFKTHLNNQVRIVAPGPAAASTTPSSSPSQASQAPARDEKAMARLSARTITKVADSCPTS
jgi:hypothetical protein